MESSTWTLPDGIDRDRFQSAVAVVLDWQENGESAVDLVITLCSVLWPRSTERGCPQFDPRVPCGYQQLLVNSAASLTIPAACGSNPSLAVIKAEVAPLRYLDNGSAPTTTVGMPIAITDAPIQYEGTISALQFIAQTSGGIVDVSFYK
jgi:hypothetical protein